MTQINPAKKAEELIKKFRQNSEGCIPWGDSGFVFNQEAQTEAAKANALICAEEKRLLLTKVYQEITGLEGKMDKESWIHMRVFLEDMGIENEQVQTEIQKL